MQQGSEEWKQARCGRVTASRVHDIVAVTRSGGFTAGRKNYLSALVWERLTGKPAPTYQSAAMAYGTECEPEARFAYALKQGVEIEEVGFIAHPTIEMAGASPDGLVGKDGLVEIKCPQSSAHLDRWLGVKIDPTYLDQMMFQMAVTGRQWCDFVSFHRDPPEEMQLHITRIMRDDKAIAALDIEVERFLIDVEATVDLLRKRYLQEAA
jgi:putative phage-type endonuclease